MVGEAGQRLPARHRHRLEPGVGPDGVEQVADVDLRTVSRLRCRSSAVCRGGAALLELA